ncbi:MAG: P-loop NTPase [Sphingobium sp.]
MNKPEFTSSSRSLLERAAEVYDFGAALRGRAAPPVAAPVDPAPVPVIPELHAPAAPVAEADIPALRAADWHGPSQRIDRAALAEAGFILPDGPVTALSEEFRLLKRGLLTRLKGNERGNRILVCSAHSGEGKTFCAINLALSLAAEKDREILLVDADFGKPGIPETLGLQSGPGLMDALADPAIAVEDIVLRTDIPSLSILPAGRHSNDDTEYLASSRTDALLRRLTEGRPDRIVLFDSPPLLAASPGATLAAHVAIALMVVRADKTPENALRDAAGMVGAAGEIQLLLNAVSFSASGRRFGSYYKESNQS